MCVLRTVLVKLVIFVKGTSCFVKATVFKEPLMLNTLIKVMLKSVPANIVVKFRLRLVFVKVRTVKTSVPPSVVMNSILNATFTVAAKGNVRATVAVTVPTTVLSTFIIGLFCNIVAPVVTGTTSHFTRRNGCVGVRNMFLDGKFLFSLAFTIVTFNTFLFNKSSIATIIGTVPK